MLENYDLAKMGPNSSEAWRLIGDASRLAFADRGRYMADSDFVSVPVKGLLNKKYLNNRATLLNRKKHLKLYHLAIHHLIQLVHLLMMKA